MATRRRATRRDLNQKGTKFYLVSTDYLLFVLEFAASNSFEKWKIMYIQKIFGPYEFDMLIDVFLVCACHRSSWVFEMLQIAIDIDFVSGSMTLKRWLLVAVGCSLAVVLSKYEL